MKKTAIIVALLIIATGCASDPFAKKVNMYAPIEASFYHINQKVAGHFFETGVPDGFDGTQYKTVVEEVCFLIPSCRTQAEEIFNLFDVSARKVDGMFSVMLCDKDRSWKVMEDFSCNNTRVEVKSWRLSEKMPCDFEANWTRVVQENCDM